MTPQEKIKVFVEEGVKEMRIQRSDYDTQCLREALHRAITLGQILGLERAGEVVSGILTAGWEGLERDAYDRPVEAGKLDAIAAIKAEEELLRKGV